MLSFTWPERKALTFLATSQSYSTRPCCMHDRLARAASMTRRA